MIGKTKNKCARGGHRRAWDPWAQVVASSPRGAVEGLGILLLAMTPVALMGCSANSPDEPREQVENQSSQLVLPGTVSDTQAEYAAKCDVATGIHVPAFNCDLGVPLPGQGTVPNGASCAEPNVLGHHCDPGARFQILSGRTADAVAVAHCRKNGLDPANSMYRDIAVIQYNKKNGAVCFYQSPQQAFDGSAVTAPSQGGGIWLPPSSNEGVCTGCHDNGAFLRSKYLSTVIPSTADGFDNLTTPYRFVGADFATNRTWAVTTTNATGDSGAPCTSCHRLAVNNTGKFGTAGFYAGIATAATQAAKIAHTAANPIWMRPNQIKYGTCRTHPATLCNAASECPGSEACVSSGADATAAKFKACSDGFWGTRSPGFTDGASVAGCGFTPLGMPWTGFSPAQLAASTIPL